MTKRPMVTQLFDTARQILVDAEFFDRITAVHLGMWAATWRPVFDTIRLAPNAEIPEDAHWDWIGKMAALGSLLSTHSFAIVCGSKLQGLMMVNDTSSGRLSVQKGKPQVYVEYLATAPWNRKKIQDPPRYAGVGKVFVYTAIQLSRSLGYKGRLGLHSLPDAESFYRDHCGMTEVGRVTGKHQNLLYFEMTESQAADYLKRKG